ncbi:hypothetical protein A2477_03470 [Candidatus Falkowbacteria bacterium RIFOXYC2_FULL_47_12]|uniref:DUF5673 domain-containing protein n=1 Tax=Candidatus Falkowbacteria bacterium RIFOXYC2_FULL_47_12 TaxID=1798004 RepID=A0A1F5TRQ9_9BACT|nr:MAG: hypothetical protein A2477_03470 [Candidatus Falkowbacteria bacterium RIFOXYC2_FULL_47_12]
MPTQKTPLSADNVLASWVVPEYEKHERSKTWYIIAAIVTVIVLLYALWSANFLFVVIIVLAAMVTMLHDGSEPDAVGFAIADEGLIIGKKFIDYDELKNFSIIYKPRQGVRKLYFEFHNVLRPRLSIGLDNMNPLKIRDILLNYLQEDLERENEPLSEQLGKLFKI